MSLFEFGYLFGILVFYVLPFVLVIWILILIIKRLSNH